MYCNWLYGVIVSYNNLYSQPTLQALTLPCLGAFKYIMLLNNHLIPTVAPHVEPLQDVYMRLLASMPPKSTKNLRSPSMSTLAMSPSTQPLSHSPTSADVITQMKIVLSFIDSNLSKKYVCLKTAHNDND